MEREQAKKRVNDLLVLAFNEILELEERAIITKEFADISNNDMHIMEAIGRGEGMRMSDVARKLGVTVGSLTTSMNALVRKGYVQRERNEEDRRVVKVYLLEKGLAAFEHHKKFHDKMTEELFNQLSEEQLEAWLSSIDVLTRFFESYR